jgi:cytoskeletal protein CcmA (bactofilin family)
MGIFGKKRSAANPDARAAQARGPSGPSGALSIIGTGMTVQGDLDANGVVKIEGTVDGDVRAAAQVLVAKGGSVRGDVETTEAVVGGTVNGAIHARERVEIQAGASVYGDITTRRISVAEGGTLNGLIRMDEAAVDREERNAEPKVEVWPRPSAPPSAQWSPGPAAQFAVPPKTPSQPS